MHDDDRREPTPPLPDRLTRGDDSLIASGAREKGADVMFVAPITPVSAPIMAPVNMLAVQPGDGSSGDAGAGSSSSGE